MELEANFRPLNLSKYLLMLLIISGCATRKDTRTNGYLLETSKDKKTWAQSYSGSLTEDENEVRSKVQLQMRQGAVNACAIGNEAEGTWVRGYLATRGEKIDDAFKANYVPEFELSCPEINAKKTEWGVK